MAAVGGAGLLLLISAPLHWGAKTMALIVGIGDGRRCVIAVVDGNDVFGVAAANSDDDGRLRRRRRGAA